MIGKRGIYDIFDPFVVSRALRVIDLMGVYGVVCVYVPSTNCHLETKRVDARPVINSVLARGRVTLIRPG